MVQTTDARQSHNLRVRTGSRFDRLTLRRVLQPRVYSLGIVVADILTKQALQTLPTIRSRYLTMRPTAERRDERGVLRPISQFCKVRCGLEV